MRHGIWAFWLVLASTVVAQKPYPGTVPLTLKGDIASTLVEGVDRFLLKEIEKSTAGRSKHWKRDFSSAAAYRKAIEPNRTRLAEILGVREKRKRFKALQLQATTSRSALVAETKAFKVYAVQWPAFADVHGDGLLLVPKGKVRASVIAIPDADQSPEQLVGLIEGTPVEARFASRMAQANCQVIIPRLISREIQPRNGRAKLSHREYVYRSAFELGRHVIGYEIQKVLALVDWLAGRETLARGNGIGVIGWGEGGLLALCAAALDERIGAAVVSGFFDNRNDVWKQPVDRNVFGLLHQFGDAEIASLVMPRLLIVEAAKGPEVTIPPGLGGAPGKLTTPRLASVQKEYRRFRTMAQDWKSAVSHLVVSGANGTGPPGSKKAISLFLEGLDAGQEVPEPDDAIVRHWKTLDVKGREQVQLHELDRHNQAVLKESPYVRQKFMSKVDTKSLAAFQKTIEPYREYFAKEIIGRFDYPLMPFGARTRVSYDRPKWTGYEVVLDVFPDVIAYGILLMPKAIREGEKRPVVVCQHGLEGRPQDVVTGDHRAYHDFAAKLAERGFITFAPQNLYIFKDRFRTLQRKANPIKKTLFSIIVPQHQQIVNWLKKMPQVDSKRIAFYGLSYGGKTAMRVPPLVTDYCLSICSADFNDWVWKNASSRAKHSYVWTGEYEIFEFDLGSTFNYSEMAALIAPRPFMVERGHFDGVAPDERVAYEFAKVRHWYQAKLGLKDRCEIEWFVGPHTINGKGTFAFLHKHLRWPEP